MSLSRDDIDNKWRFNTFPGLKKTEVSKPVDESNHVEISTYIGLRKPPMSPFPEHKVDETHFRMQMVSRVRAQDIDFFVDIITNDCPEYRRYCTRVNREQEGQTHGGLNFFASCEAEKSADKFL